MAKLAKQDFIAILTEELADTLSADVRITKKFGSEVLEAVERAYERVIIEEQVNVGFGGLGQFKVEVKGERTYRNPQGGADIVKPEHLSVKFAVSKGLKEALEATEIK